jgi:hypothetical protein
MRDRLHPFVLVATPLVGVLLACVLVAGQQLVSHGSLSTGGPLVAAATVALACGLTIALLKPRSPIVRLASIALVAIGANLVSLALGPLRPVLGPRAVVLQDWLVAAQPAEAFVIFLFVSRFPTGDRPPAVWRRAEAALAATATLLTLLLVPVVPGAAGATVAERLPPPAVTFLAFVHPAFFLAANGLSVAVAVANYRRLQSPDQRRRLRWLASAMVVAASWPALNGLLKAVTGGFSAGGEYDEGSLAEFYARMNAIWSLALTNVFIAFSYAIVRHRLFDVSVVVRRTMQYLLARRALQAMTLVPLGVLAYTLFQSRDATLGDIVTGNPLAIVALAGAVAALRFRTSLTAWLDRRFFRETADREQLLLGLVDSIRTEPDPARIAGLAAARIDGSLHPKTLSVWRLSEDGTRLVIDHPREQRDDGGALGADSWVARLTVHEDTVDWPVPSGAGIPPVERESLDRRGVRLLAPIWSTDGRLLGLLALGERRSEEPYSPADRRLLAASAAQMGAVYEVAALRSRVGREEKIRHEVLARLDEDLVNLLKECPTCGACFDRGALRCDRDGAELALTLPVERVINGKYRLDRLIGKGGMGAVYQALDLRLGRQVAVKILLGAAFGDAVALRRFEREARMAAMLAHPNIVTVYDYGGVGGGAFLVMELVPGASLRAELDRTGRIAPPILAAWFDQILDAMSTAHRSGIVHRDLKPENVVISRSEEQTAVKILDFGLARFGLASLAETSSLSVAGSIVGTFGYMSPEQLTGGEVDLRTDVFALGVMLVEALTGRRPWGGDTYATQLTAVLNEDFHLPRDDVRGAALDDALQRALAKEPSGRYASAAEMRAAVIPALRALS